MPDDNRFQKFQLVNAAGEVIGGMPDDNRFMKIQLVDAAGNVIDPAALGGAGLKWAGHPGYIAGNYYVPDDFNAATGAALGNGQIAIGLFSIHQKITIDQVGVRITTNAAGGNFQCAIYRRDATNGKATQLLGKSAAPGSTAIVGSTNTALDAPLTLDKGSYYYGFMVDNATAIALSNGNGSFGQASKFGDPADALGPSATSQIIGLFFNQAYGAWPTDLTNTALTKFQQAKVPAMQFRCSAVPAS